MGEMFKGGDFKSALEGDLVIQYRNRCTYEESCCYTTHKISVLFYTGASGAAFPLDSVRPRDWKSEKLCMERGLIRVLTLPT
jgi:hypothetical protein